MDLRAKLVEAQIRRNSSSFSSMARIAREAEGGSAASPVTADRSLEEHRELDDAASLDVDDFSAVSTFSASDDVAPAPSLETKSTQSSAEVSQKEQRGDEAKATFHDSIQSGGSEGAERRPSARTPGDDGNGEEPRKLEAMESFMSAAASVRESLTTKDHR